jgi:hypothetical protein
LEVCRGGEGVELSEDDEGVACRRWRLRLDRECVYHSSCGYGGRIGGGTYLWDVARCPSCVPCGWVYWEICGGVSCTDGYWRTVADKGAGGVSDIGDPRGFPGAALVPLWLNDEGGSRLTRRENSSAETMGGILVLKAFVIGSADMMKTERF